MGLEKIITDASRTATSHSMIVFEAHATFHCAESKDSEQRNVDRNRLRYILQINKKSVRCSYTKQYIIQCPVYIGGGHMLISLIVVVVIALFAAPSLMEEDLSESDLQQQSRDDAFRGQFVQEAGKKHLAIGNALRKARHVLRDTTPYGALVFEFPDGTMQAHPANLYQGKWPTNAIQIFQIRCWVEVGRLLQVRLGHWYVFDSYRLEPPSSS